LAREKLILNRDGTFRQEATIKATSKVDVAKGTWRYDSKSGYVRFDGGFMSVLDGFRQFDPSIATRNQESLRCLPRKCSVALALALTKGSFTKNCKLGIARRVRRTAEFGNSASRNGGLKPRD
jgi:hypothetical protein